MHLAFPMAMQTIKKLVNNKNTLSKERSSLSITALNGLRAVEDGVRNEGGLSNVAVNKGMLVSVKSSHRYTWHT